MDARVERRILEKADYVREAVTILAAKRDALSFEDYRTDREQRDVVEREFETAIEACIDIGKLLLKATTQNVPSTNAAVFRELGNEEVLDASTAERMAQAAGFRNILSHRYGNEIDTETSITFFKPISRSSRVSSSRSGICSTECGIVAR